LCRSMNEKTTKNLPDKRPFEERVIARFDAFDARFDSIDARFDRVDSQFDNVNGRLEQLEARNYNTKPIWERALAAITETRFEVGEIKIKVSVIEGKVSAIETKVNVIEAKVQILENDVNSIKIDQRSTRNELIDIRRDLKHRIGEKVDLILRFFLENREDIRDAEARIRELESKLA
jgi:chromosome segregation ATPase